MPFIIPAGGVGCGGLEISTLANETPDAFSPVPATTWPSIAETALATPLFGKSTAWMDKLGLHQLPALPPEPRTISPPSSFTTVTPFVPDDWDPRLKSSSLVSI